MLRIGRVTNVYPEGRVKVQYEDLGSTSKPLSMLTFNREYSLPKVGERVITLHMDNSPSKGFVLGTYFDGGGIPAIASSGYKKELDNASISSEGGNIVIEANGNLILKCSYQDTSLEALIKRIEALESRI